MPNFNITTLQSPLIHSQERVRHTAIPLEEVFKRNARGHELSLPPPAGVGKRGETLLIMSGMVSKCPVSDNVYLFIFVVYVFLSHYLLYLYGRHEVV